MFRPFRAAVALAGAWIALLVPLGCGGGKTVVHVSGAPNASVNVATLDHWMQAIAGADFRQTIGAEGPRGLVSEPANYKRCIEKAKLVAPRSFFNQLQLSREALTESCHELYRSIKAQALSFLISVQWDMLEGAERDIAVSEAQVGQAFQRLRKHRYPSETDLHKYLAERQWSLADLLYQLKHDLLASRLHGQSIAAADEVGGEPAYEKVLADRHDQLAARTICAPGYIVPNCSAYHGPPAISPAPSAILVHLVRKNG